MVNEVQYGNLRTEQVEDVAGLYAETEDTFKLYEKVFERGNQNQDNFAYRRTEEVERDEYNNIIDDELDNLNLGFNTGDPDQTGKSFSYLNGDEANDLDNIIREEYQALISEDVQAVKGGEEDGQLVLYEHVLDQNGDDRYRKTELVSGQSYAGACAHADFRTGMEDTGNGGDTAFPWLDEFFDWMQETGESVEEYAERWDEAKEPWANVAGRYTADEDVTTPSDVMANDMERGAAAAWHGIQNILGGNAGQQQVQA